jgi:hypothetical protein
LIGSSLIMGHVEIHNVGKLPARSVTAVVRMTRADQKQGASKRFRPPKSLEATTRVIQPGVRMRMGCSDEDCVPFSMLLANGGYVFVWGAVFYRDGYKKRRFTRFCHRYHWESRDRDVEAISVAGPPTKANALISCDKARHHPSGNEAN